MNILKLKVILI